jgi:hypothetical protein
MSNQFSVQEITVGTFFFSVRQTSMEKTKRSRRLSTAVVTLLLFALVGFGLFLRSGSAYAQDATHSPGWVVISVPDYHTLRVKAFPAEREPEPPPVDATLSRVDYDLRVDNDFAAGLREAKLDGKPLSLASLSGAKSGSQFSALLSHTGRSVIMVEIALPITASASEERVSIPSTFSGVTKVTLEIPRPGVDLSLSGGLFSESKELASGGSWTAYGKGVEPIVFAWRRKAEERHSTLPLRMHGALTEFVGLGEDSTSVSANVALEVAQGAAKGARIELPENVTINQVQGDGGGLGDEARRTADHFSGAGRTVGELRDHRRSQPTARRPS